MVSHRRVRHKPSTRCHRREMQHQCSRLIRPSICLRRTFVSSSSSHYPRAARPSPKPWFVEEDAGSGRFPSPTSQGSQTHSSLSPPPPTEAPKPLHTLHSHLSTLPLLQSVTVLRASALDELRGMDEPLPSRKPHGKRNRGAVSFGGDGVGDPPPLWDWVVYAEVKEGAEKRGAVDAVIRSALKTVRRV